ncbi:MAG: 2-oxoglutarate dehydrogenase, E2 component, dihydrolipoamide succinyltransferase [Bacteroidota bacterium]|jgi:2-oxoglutarate dehydrogenase E2 component (dihydrolipoamide succinyltransferase)
MALVDVIMPQMGESIAEGTISKWLKKVGEKVSKDETLLEISTDKVDSEIPSPSSGIIAELLFPETTTVAVHTVIARINTDIHATATPSEKPPIVQSPAKEMTDNKLKNEHAAIPSSSRQIPNGNFVDVVMPQMGESIAEGTITKWHKKVGEKIGKDETLLEISTDKVDSEIPSPAAGILAEIIFPEQSTVNVNTTIARIGIGSDVIIPNVSSRITSPIEKTIPLPQAQPAFASPVSTGESTSGKFYSPLVLNIARTEGISMTELEEIPGTGANGRVSKNDILTYVQSRKSGNAGTKNVQSAAPVSPARSTPAMSYPAGRVDVIKMDTMRKAIAEHMVRSKHTSAHVGSLSEADLSNIVKFREKHKSPFEKREGFKLTFTPFFLEAVVKAIKDFPLMNASVDGDSIIVRKDINIGVAVALENGLIVPVIKNADQKNLVGLGQAINDLAARARNKKLMPDEVTGGTFTVTNPGSFGNLYGFPIINQPQVAILGIGAIKKRPVVIDDAIAIRSMVYISMSYDHRIIDGALGGMFMQKVVYYLENFDVHQSL